MRDWRPLAEQGEAAAQYELGCMYEEGESVPQDYVQAHKWYNIVAVQGFTSAADKRDAIDMKMTSSQIARCTDVFVRRIWNPENGLSFNISIGNHQRKGFGARFVLVRGTFTSES